MLQNLGVVVGKPPNSQNDEKIKNAYLCKLTDQATSTIPKRKLQVVIIATLALVVGSLECP
jgi:hypothetical protein